jgi:hypothetical protein
MIADHFISLVGDAVNQVMQEVNAGMFTDYNEATIPHQIPTIANPAQEA